MDEVTADVVTGVSYLAKRKSRPARRRGMYNLALVDCPNCKLVNPPNAMRCDCGYDFQTHTIERSNLAESSMFDYDPQTGREPIDYTGLKIAGVLAPVFFLITFLRNADMALAACIVLGMIIFAIKVRWHLRRYLWFWAIIGFILALHVPLLRMVRWPQGNVPTLFYTMPLGIMDFLIISGALGLAERFFSKRSS